MPPSLFDHRGQAVTLGPSVGRGGEAEVFELPNSRLAKVYHQPPAPSKAIKLGYMVGAGTPDLLKVAAWPVATLHERPQGPILGFVMPRMVGCKPLHQLYAPVSRRREFPDRNWDFLIQVAMNCAAAFDSVHGSGTVIGDVNANNLMTSQDATVRVIDCDSFQFQANGQRFLCEVGVPEYTPPELQEKPFAGVVRTPNHDCFGLAVLTFQLLFMGRHPFAGRYLGKGEMPQERSIKELRFAFGQGAASKLMAAPPHSFPFKALPHALADLFERAFADGAIRGGRPTPLDWMKGLGALKAQLSTCTVDPVHKFPSQVTACPWCTIASNGGPLFFISAHLALDFTCAPGDLDRLLSELQKLFSARSKPQVLTAASAPTPTPLPPDAQAARRRAPIAYAALGGSLAAVAGSASWAIYGATVVPLVTTIITASMACISLLWLTWLQNWSAYGVERRARVAALAEAENDYASIVIARDDQAKRFEQGVVRCQQQADQLRRSYGALLGEYNTELAHVTRNSEVANRRAFLESHEIAHAKIEKVGPAKTKALIGCGIETAYDVLHGHVDGVPGIGPTLQARLVAWARTVESRFRFDPSKGLPEGDRRALVARYRHRQTSIRGDLETLVSQCRSAVAQYESAQQQTVNAEIAADVRLKSAQANITLVPRRANWPVVAALALVAAWLGGFAAFESGGDRTSVSAVSHAPPRDAGIVDAVDDFREGMEVILQPGGGASRRLAYQPSDGQRQRVELTVETTLSEGNDVGRLPRTTVQGIMTAHTKGTASVDYTLLIQAISVSEPGALDPEDQKLKASIGKLATSSITATVSADGKLLAMRVDKVTQTDPMFQFPMGQLQQAFTYMFIPAPNDPLTSGARWRVRQERPDVLPHREESLMTAPTVTQTEIAVDRSTKFSAIPTTGHVDAAVTAVDGTLVVHSEMKSNDVVPTLTGTYDIAADVDGKTVRQHQKVSIRPL